MSNLGLSTLIQKDKTSSKYKRTLINSFLNIVLHCGQASQAMNFCECVLAHSNHSLLGN